MYRKQQYVFILEKSLNQENVIKTAALVLADQATLGTVSTGMISVRLVSKLLVNSDKFYKSGENAKICQNL